MPKRILPHIQQQANSQQCGACCLAMLYKLWGIDYSVDQIWQEVSDYSPCGNRYCRTSKMILSAQKAGVHAMAVTVREIIPFLKKCLSNDLEAIVLYNPKPKKPTAHFSVVSYIDDQYIYLNDPMLEPGEGTNRRIRTDSFVKMCLRNPNIGEMTRSNTVLVFAPPHTEVKCIEVACSQNAEMRMLVIDSVKEDVEYILHPQTDRLIPL